MKLFAISTISAIMGTQSIEIVNDGLDCRPLGCHYDPLNHRSELIACNSNGVQSAIFFHGNNDCTNWNQFDEIIQSEPNNPCCQDRKPIDNEEQKGLIVGGTSVTYDKYPFIASLGEHGNCGGSILRKSSPAMILTAAHCYRAFTDVVKLGANKIGDNNAITATVKSYIIHPDFNPDTGANDIAILWLNTDISSKTQLAQIDPIEIVPTGSDCCKSGDDLQVIGYGIDLDGNPTPTLEFVDVNYIERSICKTKYEQDVEITENMICAAASGKDSCKGDSGGPLIKKNTRKQVGIVSFGGGDNCADPNFPGVYTDLSDYKQWIDTQRNLSTPPLYPSSAEVFVVCDNMGEYFVSQNGGDGEIAESDVFFGYSDNPAPDSEGELAFWETAFPIGKVTSQTVLKLECTDTNNIGGLIATIKYKGKEYSTKQGGNFKLVGGATTSLSYKSQTNNPWKDKLVSSGIASDAMFMWNGQNKNKMLFEFKFANIM